MYILTTVYIQSRVKFDVSQNTLSRFIQICLDMSRHLSAFPDWSRLIQIVFSLGRVKVVGTSLRWQTLCSGRWDYSSRLWHKIIVQIFFEILCYDLPYGSIITMTGENPDWVLRCILQDEHQKYDVIVSLQYKFELVREPTHLSPTTMLSLMTLLILVNSVSAQRRRHMGIGGTIAGVVVGMTTSALASPGIN